MVGRRCRWKRGVVPLLLTVAMIAGAPQINAKAAVVRFTPQAQWCKSARIVFFPGGPAGGVFADNVYNGARQAELDLGPKVQ